MTNTPMDLAEMESNAADAEAFMKLLANRNRLMILCSLIDHELNVSELNKRVPLAQSALSQHLAALRNAELVTTRREGPTIYYAIGDARVVSLINSLYQMFCK